MSASQSAAESPYMSSAQTRENELISIIMPIYNRERFLREAIASIKAQQYENWELIIVDDGSSDNSIDLLPELTADIATQVQIIKQSNQGPAAARNNGIRQANGSLLAFFDSDDLWLPHHLSDSIKAFINHPELSWIYSACERVLYETGELLQKSTFYTDNHPNKLFDIAKREPDGIYKLDTEQAILLQLTQGLDNGLQNSVLKREITNAHLIPDFRVGEDRLFIIMALKSGFKMGFIDKIHVRYHVHDENISDTNKNEDDFDKRILALETLIRAKLALPLLVPLNDAENALYKQQLSKELFWELGYSLYQSRKNYKGALKSYLRAIRLYPWKLKYYRTFVIALLKYTIDIPARLLRKS